MITIDPEFLDWISGVRRDFHMHPELSNQEYRTTQQICSILKELDIQVQTLPKSPGAVALIQGSSPGPTLALRADIDALPIQELNCASYRSCIGNKMHACGHDAHTAIMLGVARTIMEKNLFHKLKGNVKFLFQPAEEKIDGAHKMIKQGVLENPKVDRVIAGHMAPDLDIGTIGIFKRYGYAAAEQFELTITGKGGHAGRPHETIDPISCGAYFVTAIHTIVARNIDPIESAVVSVGKFQSGDVGNVIPESTYIEGTIRTHSERIREIVFNRLNDIVKGMQTLFNVRCNLKIIHETPSCNCDKSVNEFMYQSAQSIVGKENVKWLPPTMGSEDFAYFTKERPSSIIRLGCRNKEKKIISPLHSPYFDIDETVLEIGVKIFCEAIFSYLS